MTDIHLPTPRSSSSGDQAASEPQTSSLNVVYPESRVNLGVTMLEYDEPEVPPSLDEFHWLLYLKRWFFAIKHQENETDEEESDNIAMFLNSEADNIENYIEAMEPRSVARGLVFLGGEVRGLFHKLQQAEVRSEHQQLQLASYQQQLQKISVQYGELKEQLQATSSFSRLSSTRGSRGSFPTISFSGASRSSAARSGDREQEQRLQEETKAEQTRLQGLVEKLQTDLITARRDEADARRRGSVADTRATELEQQLEEARDSFESEMLACAEEKRRAIDEAKAREVALEERLRQRTDQVMATDDEQSIHNIQVPALKELLRTASEQEAALLKQVREMQIELATRTPAVGQEERAECASEKQAQSASLQSQLQEIQQVLQEVKEQHQLEVSDLQAQLARQTGQVGSDTKTEREVKRKITTRNSLLKPDGGVMQKTEMLAQFLAGNRNVSMGRAEQARIEEVVTELIDWEQGEEGSRGLFSVPHPIKPSERTGIDSSLRAQAAKEFKNRSELHSLQNVMARIAEILPTYGRERSILQAALCEGDVKEAQKLYRKLYEETGEASDVVDKAQAEDGELLLLIVDSMLSKLDDGFKADISGTNHMNGITITKLPSRARGFTALVLAEIHFFPPRWDTMLTDFQNLLTMHEHTLFLSCSNNLFCHHYETMELAIHAFEQRHASISATTLLQMLSLQIIMKSSVTHIVEYRKLSTESGTLDKDVLTWTEATKKIPKLMEDLIHLERQSPNPHVSRLFSKPRKTLPEARKAISKSNTGSQRPSVFHVQESDQLDSEPVAVLTRLVELTHFRADTDPEYKICGSRHGSGAGCLKPSCGPRSRTMWLCFPSSWQ